jgi:anti-anti-sigma factor
MEGAMELRTGRIGSAVILHLEGRLTVETGTGWWNDADLAVTGQGVRHVLVDMGKVSQLDCWGIGQLLQIRRLAHDARKTFALVALDGRQQRMLRLAGLLHVFRVFGGCGEAVLALGIEPRRFAFATADMIAAWAGLVGGRTVACAAAATGAAGTEWVS